MKWVVVAILVAAAVAGAFLEGQRRAHNEEAERVEQAALEAARAKRAILEADTKGRQEIMRWKAAAARHEAEVRRLRSAAATAAKEVKAVVTAGETLVASGTTEEIIAALKARGYNPVRCTAVGK